MPEHPERAGSGIIATTGLFFAPIDRSLTQPVQRRLTTKQCGSRLAMPELRYMPGGTEIGTLK
jgi:hypothetical protein